MKPIPENTNFKVPENYFKDQQNKWLLKTNTAFKTPESYFRNSEKKIIDQTKFITPKNSFFNLKNSLKYAAVFIFLILGSVIFINQYATKKPTNEYITYQNLYSLLLEEEDYLSFNNTINLDIIQEYYELVSLTKNNNTLQPTNLKNIEKQLPENNPAEEILYDLYIESEEINLDENEDDYLDLLL